MPGRRRAQQHSCCARYTLHARVLHAAPHKPWPLAPNAGATHQPGLLCELHMDTARGSTPSHLLLLLAPAPLLVASTLRNTYTARLLKQACKLHHAHAPGPPRQRAAALHSSRAPGPWQGASSAAPIASHTCCKNEHVCVCVLAMGPKARQLPSGRRHWCGMSRPPHSLVADAGQQKTYNITSYSACRRKQRHARVQAHSVLCPGPQHCWVPGWHIIECQIKMR